jgi:transcriptional regulator with XRE-family HTH domain
MTTKHVSREPARAPDGFRALVKTQMEQQGVSLRHVAAQAELSPAYLSRLLSGERGLPPDDDLILRLARVLAIDPPELLLVEAERIPDDLMETVPVLLSAHRATSPAELKQVMKKLQALLLARRRTRKKT